MTEENQELFRKLAGAIVGLVDNEKSSLMMIEIIHPDGEHAIVFVVVGTKDCDRIRPALNKICPRHVVRDGVKVPA